MKKIPKIQILVVDSWAFPYCLVPCCYIGLLFFDGNSIALAQILNLADTDPHHFFVCLLYTSRCV